MALSAFGDKSKEPQAVDLQSTLGRSSPHWASLVAHIAAEYAPLEKTWNFAGAKYGWSCRLRQKKRTILYLIPQDKTFLVGVVLGDRAMTLLRRDAVSQANLALIDAAPRYGEGTGFRIPVISVSDCADIELVIEAKMS